MAGLGSGHTIKSSDQIELNSDCKQFSWSYPVLLNARGMLGDNSLRRIQHLACSGAKADDVLKRQIPKLKPSQLIMLSIGGNDAHLSSILNYCVYQWSLAWTWTCAKELEAAHKDIDSKEFFDNLGDIMELAKGKLIDKNSRIIWTGYERFFNADTKECDKVTWGFIYKFGFREYLTQARRKEMNNLVDKVNHVIKGVCDEHDECIFVDSNKQIEAFRGRFCEPGVDETYQTGNGANRETTKDNDDEEEKKIDQPQKRVDIDLKTMASSAAKSWNNDNSTFEGSIASFIADGIEKGNLTFGNGDEQSSEDIVISNSQEDFSVASSSWYRIFHRTKVANGIVALNVLAAIEKYQAELMQQTAPIFTLPGACHNGPSKANLWDAAGKEMVALTDFKPLADEGSEWKSNLENKLVLKGNRYKIDFALGNSNWSTDDKDKKDNWCNKGGYDPRQGPSGMGRGQGGVCQPAHR
ncbi:hypothetical protein EsH8_III_001477 [Colletotrichum jinshuiense]